MARKLKTEIDRERENQGRTTAGARGSLREDYYYYAILVD
jgi:hypothetical protein